MKKYEKLEHGWGRVYKARDKETGRLVALKKTTLEMEEVSLLQMLSHSPYVVRLLCTERIEKYGKALLYLVFEYLDTNLKKFIDSHTEALLPSTIQSFLYQLCNGVAHCHSHGVLHCDLKPHNLLVDKDKGILKISHLPLARPLKTHSSEIVTLCYRAPEVLLGSTHYSTGVDMWSVGCIFAEMARKHALFLGVCEFEQLMHIFSLLGTPAEKQWPDVALLRYWNMQPRWEPQNLAYVVPSLGPEGIDLLSMMLKYDPDDRISAMAAMDHPYFDTLDKSQFQIYVNPI